MLGSQRECGIIVHIGQDLLHFLQAGGRHDEAQFTAGLLIRMETAAGQTEAVHGDGGDGGIGDLKLDTGMDGAALIFTDGKNRAGDQFLQLVLRDADGSAGVDIGQIGVIVSTLSGNGEGCVACTDGHLVALVHHNGDGAFGQAADNVAKELSGQDALAGVGDLSFHIIGNRGFHVIAGEADAQTCLAQDTFDGGQTALLGDGAACNVQALNQHTFFTGKTHIQFPFLVKNRRYIYP